ncbi:MAG TPA: DM13 domain-containing protein [Pyrinomonadaceae bacterium]|nr:DM13 domain-containing protein [Pyrinomonadaceae bacterium]
MSRKLIVVVAALIFAGGAWYAFRPERLFVNQTVSEQFPVASAAAASTKELASGSFHKVAHDTRGTATVYELPGGRRTLRLANFETSNGPDVRVYLVAAGDAADSETVKQAGFVEVGALKGNIGDQNYDLPAGVDLGKYRAVTIWCRRFGVNFGTAPLGAPGTAAAEPKQLAAGSFHDGAHETKGQAAVYQLADGKRVLRLTDFQTSNGPDVRVYLVAADDAKDNDTVKSAGFIEISPLKGNVGDQNYELPAGADLAKYRAVTIWCERFGVNFGTAPLKQS